MGLLGNVFKKIGGGGQGLLSGGGLKAVVGAVMPGGNILKTITGSTGTTAESTSIADVVQSYLPGPGSLLSEQTKKNLMWLAIGIVVLIVQPWKWFGGRKRRR